MNDLKNLKQHLRHRRHFNHPASAPHRRWLKNRVHRRGRRQERQQLHQLTHIPPGAIPWLPA